MNKSDVMEKISKSLFQLKFPRRYSKIAVTIIPEANPMNIKVKLTNSTNARIIAISTEI